MEFQPSITQDGLQRYVAGQCNSFFPDGHQLDPPSLQRAADVALGRVKFGFGMVNLPYYRRDNNVFFNHLNGDHYCVFLCYLSRALFDNGMAKEATKTFLLNKALHGIDAFYEIQLPDIFTVVHPLGTVLGRASYGNRLMVYQGVTVGATAEGIYPRFGERTILYSNSSVIGKCNIGTNFVAGAGSTIINTDVESNMTVTGNYPHHKISDNGGKFSTYFYD